MYLPFPRMTDICIMGSDLRHKPINVMFYYIWLWINDDNDSVLARGRVVGD